MPSGTVYIHYDNDSKRAWLEDGRRSVPMSKVRIQLALGCLASLGIKTGKL